MGRIHSIETLGTLDGPGIRMVVFFQGCTLRCLYCHNPDTWQFNSGHKITCDFIVNKALNLKPYFSNCGGITFSGGEPLAQPKFLLKCLKKCKEKGLHTAIDTSGVGFGNYEEILEYCDLIILDIKHEDANTYKQITNHSITEYLSFKEAVIKSNKKLWLKHVVVPKLTDSITHIECLAKEINSFNKSNIEKVELLAYHSLGVYKYQELNIPYSLNTINDMNLNKLNKLQKILNELI
ncbi:pyruvate formate lyase-activating protein [Clostridium sp. 'deep sea']|uniref:pyruvate formate-lyase-activating protein n=1 Tax=Clostridium sp. 'deep sea' TaxID=2779445 RepID=UPI0018966E45|nr:pyruvate formate-lyase-activating protein [Clostridium sp. 'deep sea']QOR34976.1 pyruvate formate lyase-activating protein [Clostridium sp. 'deep sea']